MAIDFKLDPVTGDLDFTGSTFSLTRTIEESSQQQITIALRTYRGEWFADITAGVPYLTNDNNDVQLLGTTRKGLIDSYIQSVVLSRENIVEIVSYSSSEDPVNLTLEVSLTALTTTGETIQATATV